MVDDQFDAGRRVALKSGLAISAVAAATSSGCSSDNTSGAASNRQTASQTDSGSIRTPQQVAPLFLTDQEMSTLKALADQLIPPDIQPGGGATGCHEGIQFLLSAFSFNPPMIYAGGPFSDRAGSSENHFQKFVPLDSYEALAWRTRIEGSSDAALENNIGEIKGWQAVYRQGLSALNQESASYGSPRFEKLLGPLQTVLLNASRNPAIQELVDLAYPHCLQFMYGAPEYGGNKNQEGWKQIAFQGDMQPQGYTAKQVVTPDNPGLADLLGLNRNARGAAPSTSSRQLPMASLLPVPSLGESLQMNEVFRQLIAMSSDEFSLAMVVGSESRLSRMKEFVGNKILKAPVSK